MENTGDMTELIDSLKETVGEPLRSVALGDVRTLEFELSYMADGAEEFMSEEERLDAFKDLSIGDFFETDEPEESGPLGELRFTDRVYENVIIIVGWLGKGTDEIIVVAVDTDVDLIPEVIGSIKDSVSYE